MGAVAALFAMTRAAAAEPSAAEPSGEAPRPDPRVFSASPESASTSIGWRTQLRGRIGVAIPLVGENGAGPGFALRLPAFIELHNFTASAIPYQLWRGRLVIDGSFAWRTRADDARSPLLRLGLGIEHESDHTSVSQLVHGYLNLNSLAVHGDAVLPLGERTVFYASALARLHVLTCTRDPVLCEAKNGVGGSRAFEASVEADVSHALSPASDDDVWLLFAATYATFLLPSGLAVAERRATLEAGVADATRRRGTFQLFATSLFGDDVGFFRGTRQVVQAGGGIRWTP